MPDDITKQTNTNSDDSTTNPTDQVTQSPTPPVEEKVEETVSEEKPEETATTDSNTEIKTDQNSMESKVADELLNQDIFKVMKLENLSEEEKNNLKDKMTDTVMGRIIARIMDKLNSEDQKQFETILDSGNNEEVEKFIDSKINIKDILAQETILYKAEMIDNAQKIDEMVKKSSSDKSSDKSGSEEPTTAVI